MLCEVKICFSIFQKKSREIYYNIIAHRGYYYVHPENTYNAFLDAINRHMTIETDVRITKDDYLVCFHDRYTKRMFGKFKKFSNLTLRDLKKYNIKNSVEKVALLNDLLKLTNSKVPLLLEIKGFLTNRFKKRLLYLIINYDGNIYFHAKNIITYFKLRRIWKNKVFYILNPFRKRFNFIKSRYYKRLYNNCIT